MMKCIVCGNETNGGICTFCGYNSENKNEPQHMLPGSRLKEGRYSIGQVVGAGGFGITYSAWDTVLKQRVAIKEYLPGEFATRLNQTQKVTIYGGEKEEQFKDGLEKFFDESKRLAKFREVSGIVQIYDCFKENETAYIVMEFLYGETLGQRINSRGKLEPNEVLEIFKPILEALEAVHKEGIVHRDISPGNIFICDDGSVKLLDFGAARSATGTHSKSLTVLYKEGYTAEEQYRSRGEQGPWTDVYATAATMYKALTGETPIGAMERRLNDQLKAPSKCGVNLPKNVDIAIMNALNVDYRDRTKTAREFSEELMSETEVRNRVSRTKENVVGRIPTAVWITAGSFMSILTILLILLATDVIHFYPERFSNLFTENGKVRVMNVVNMEQTVAEERLKGIGLTLEVADVKYSNDIAEGRIISQEEQRGMVVDEGSTIHVVVSNGAEKVIIPDIVDLEKAEAEELLEELHLECKLIEENSIYAPGRVARCEPQVGQSVEQGNIVQVYVSKGMEYNQTTQVTLTDYSGNSISEVREDLAGQGVYIVKNEENWDDNIPKGYIISHNPEQGAIVNSGDIVYINASLGIEPKEVPDVINMDREEAETVLNKLSLNPIIETEIHKELPENQVIAQNIAAETVVDKYTEIVLTVAIHGYDVPNLVGMSRAEAENVCRQNGFTPVIEEVLGGNGNTVGQTPEANEVVEEQGVITINVGLSEADFTQRIVSQVNARRAGMGLGGLALNGAYSQVAQLLANAGYDSSTWGDWSWARRQVGVSPSFSWCGTRGNITSVNDAVSRLSFLDYALGRGSSTYIGVAYSGKSMVVVAADN